MSEIRSYKSSSIIENNHGGNDGPFGSSCPPELTLLEQRIHVQHSGVDRSALKELPTLRHTPPVEQEDLFIQKLQLCSVIFRFANDNNVLMTYDDNDKQGKDLKRLTLLELVDYVNDSSSNNNNKNPSSSAMVASRGNNSIFTERVMHDLMKMFSFNLCRYVCLSKQTQTQKFKVL